MPIVLEKNFRTKTSIARTRLPGRSLEITDRRMFFLHNVAFECRDSELETWRPVDPPCRVYKPNLQTLSIYLSIRVREYMRQGFERNFSICKRYLELESVRHGCDGPWLPQNLTPYIHTNELQRFEQKENA